MQLKTVVRGKLRQIAASDGSPVDVRLYGCMVVQPPHVKNGKKYARFDVSDAVGDVDVLSAVDGFVARHVSAGSFSPLRDGGQLVVKVPADLRYENDSADPTDPWTMTAGQVVDVELRPGAFGDFGYCWLLRRVKPAAKKIIMSPAS